MASARPTHNGAVRPKPPATEGGVAIPLTVDGSTNGGFDIADWRAGLERCREALSGVPEVAALVVAGSGADDALVDGWSDLDLIVVVADAAMERFTRGLQWLAPIGEVYAWDASSAPDRQTVRVCFADLRRVDFLVVPESRFAAFASAPGPLQGGARVVLDRTDGALAQALRWVPAEGAGDAADTGEEAFRRMEREFRWNGVLSAVKVGRGDLLIGAHLALEMAQSCLVLGMLLRDRALGTRHHRHGDRVALPLRLPPVLTSEGVIDLIVTAVQNWETLAAQWEPGYVFPKAPLLALLGRDPEAGEDVGVP